MSTLGHSRCFRAVRDDQLLLARPTFAPPRRASSVEVGSLLAYRAAINLSDAIFSWRCHNRGPPARHVIGTHERNGPMTVKVNLLTAAPDLVKVWTGASLAIAASLEPSLIELVKIRASQINGCANCINMHTTEARSQG